MFYNKMIKVLPNTTKYDVTKSKMKRLNKTVHHRSSELEFPPNIV